MTIQTGVLFKPQGFRQFKHTLIFYEYVSHYFQDTALTAIEYHLFHKFSAQPLPLLVGTDHNHKISHSIVKMEKSSHHT